MKRFLLLTITIGMICFGEGCTESRTGENQIIGNYADDTGSTELIDNEETANNAEVTEITDPAETVNITELTGTAEGNNEVNSDVSETAAAVQIKLSEEEEKEKKIILLGDSRSVGLYCSMIYSEEEYPSHVFYHIAPDYTGSYENTTFIVKAGEGYSWFSACGMPLAEPYIDEDSVIVVWFGVNDLGSMEKYINFMNTSILSYGVPVYYMTIGPCDKHWEYQAEEVNHFNIGLLTLLDQQIQVIDANSFIRQGLEDGTFATMDGLHYDYNTSRAIYEYMVEAIDIKQDE